MTRLAAVLLASMLSFTVVGCESHYQIHPKTVPSDVETWSSESVHGALKVRSEWAKPAGVNGPLPAILVHPEAGSEATDMRGILRTLAQRGYLAMAADYMREVRPGVFKEPFYTWRDESDAAAAVGVLREHPQTDQERVGALGFSQGGVYSLLIEAYTGQIDAVVAYYPVTDFERWLEIDRPWPKSTAFFFIRRYFYRRSGADNDAEFSTFLARTSAYQQADTIHAPVLLIHGDRDTSAPLSESEALHARLGELGRESELLVIEDAGHIFNFEDAAQAQVAWDAAMGWFERWLE
ncbi:MAG: alpha/beta fold hydrolase [Acidobacteriota bacterium]